MRNHEIEAPPREVLEKLYVGEGLSLAETGRRLGGVATSRVIIWLVSYGMRPRTKAEGRAVAKKHEYSEETLVHMRERAAAMREKITPEGIARGAEKKRGRPAPNRGKPWSDEQRRKIMEQRSSPEYRQMMSEKFRGDKSPNWKGGVKSELNRRLDTAFWRRRRQECYARDNWLCRDCGVKCKNSADARNDGKRKIQAHHVVARRDGGSDELVNLVTLCMSCHHKRERNFRKGDETSAFV